MIHQLYLNLDFPVPKPRQLWWSRKPTSERRWSDAGRSIIALGADKLIFPIYFSYKRMHRYYPHGTSVIRLLYSDPEPGVHCLKRVEHNTHISPHRPLLRMDHSAAINGQLQLVHVVTDDMMTNKTTKPLSHTKHAQFVEQLGLALPLEALR